MGIIKQSRPANDDDLNKLNQPIQETDYDSWLSHEPTLREERVAARNDFTDACQEAGADRPGMARATNATYSGLWGGQRPTGDLDQWSKQHQKEIAVGEHFAANEVRAKVPPKKSSSWWGWGEQQEANEKIADAAYQGAKTAREAIDDPTNNGNPWGWLFGSNERDPEPEPEPAPEPEPQQSGGFWSSLLGEDLWGNK